MVFHCITAYDHNGIHRVQRVTFLTYTKQQNYSTKYSIHYVLS